MLLMAAVFVGELSLGDQVHALIERLSITPDHLTSSEESPWQLRSLFAALSGLFLHSSWVALGFNLLYLRVFGDNLERSFGRVLYALLLLSGGILGTFFQTIYNPYSEVPIVGFGAGVSAALTAYWLIYPGHRVQTIFPVVVVLTVADVPAWVLLIVFHALQWLNRYMAIGQIEVQIPWMSYPGGILMGLLFGLGYRLARHRRRRAKSDRRPQESRIHSSDQHVQSSPEHTA